MYIKSYLIFISIVFASNLFFSSCNKDNDNQDTTLIPKVATITSYDIYGNLHEKVSYQYDNIGRLIKIIYNDSTSYDLIEYSASTVTIKSYTDEKLKNSLLGKLNDNGLCISASSDVEYYLFTFKYDSNGYRKTSISESATRIYTESFTVFEGNFVIINTENNPKTTKSATFRELDFSPKSGFLKNFGKRYAFQNNLKFTAEYDEKTDYQFYTDKMNTIEDENLGVSFNGKQNKNPVKQETFTYSLNGQTITETTSYTYEYDTKDRITKQIEDKGSYTIFTYAN